jgi:hypothetical protein
MKRVGLVLAAVTFGSTLAQPGPERANAIYENYKQRLTSTMDRYYHDGQYWTCIGYLRVRLGAAPADSHLSSDLVWMYGNVGEHDLAVAQAVRYRASYPTDAVAAEAEATIYRNRKLWERMPPILEPVLQFAVTPNAFVLCAQAYEELGMLRQALRVLELRLQKIPSDLTAVKNRERIKKLLEGK